MIKFNGLLAIYNKQKLLFLSSFIILFSGTSILEAQQDSLSINMKSIELKQNTQKDTTSKVEVSSPSGVDSVITFFAEDTVKINLSTKKALLKKNASVSIKKQKLTAATIEIDFNTSTLRANLERDSSGTALGVPCMNDNGEEFFGKELIYNIKTNTGTINAAETKMGEGYYFGMKIKRISRNEMFIKDGYFTTCDAPAPHYHFGSSKMKMRIGEKLFADPLYFYVEDIPIFVVPIGLFLPMQHGRRSGLIVPSFYFSQDRGVVFQNLGFYWAASNYWDTKLTVDLYSKGGFILNNQTQWTLKDVFSGRSNISFGNTRLSLDDNFSKEWKLELNHNHTITPYENASINLNFASKDFNRNTSTDLNQRIKQSMRSSASYSKTFENGVNTSLSFQNDQDIITREYTGSVPLSVSVPQVQLVKKLFHVPTNQWYSWVRDITFNYRGNAFYNFYKKQSVNSYQTNEGTKYDTVMNSDGAGYIAHTPTLTITPKLGYFNISPNINFAANNYFRKIVKTYNTLDSTVSEELQRGFFTEYNYSFGIGTSTRLYGVADEKNKFLGFIDPNIVGIKAFRHTYQPSLNFNYTPDFSTENYNFYGSYFDEKNKRTVKYSFYEKEGGSHASSFLQKRISYSDMHSFEIKRKGKDTLPDENLELLRLTCGLSYNLAADSLRFSDLSTTFRTPAIKFIDFSGNANFTLYDEKSVNLNGNERFERVNEFLLSNGKGFARLTNATINISTSFSSQGFIDKNTNVDTAKKTGTIDNELGGRFLRRDAYIENDGDIYGENSCGYSRFAFPWSASLGLNYNYLHTNIGKIDRKLNLTTSFDFTLAETWKVSTRFQYDLINMQFIAPEINLTKDLHCWDLTASWYPTGYNQGFYIRFGIKSSQLKDLKIEKRDSPVFR